MKKNKGEANHFDSRDMADRRKVSWSRLQGSYKEKTLYPDTNREEFISSIGQRNRPGLALACGDMKGEAKYFKLLKSSSVDAFDISEVTLDRAKLHCASLGLNVNLQVGDINTIELPKQHYGLVVVAHSFHHFEKIDRIAKQIAESMLPDAIFILFDYVGPRCLQFSPQQLEHANKFFKRLPPSLRTDRKGEILSQVHPPLRWGLSENEAIESPKILPAIENNFSCIKGLLYGGLMHPVLERVSASFDTENPKHVTILDRLWALDRKLIDNREIEPNFCELILVRKDNQLTEKYPAQSFNYRPIEIDERYEWLVQTSSREIWRLKEIIGKQHKPKPVTSPGLQRSLLKKLVRRNKVTHRLARVINARIKSKKS